MPIHLNPFRLYRGRLCLNHGLLVNILRSTQRFWIAYKHLLELNGKRQSSVKELRTVMDKMGLKTKKKLSRKQSANALATVHVAFEEGLKDLENMFSSLNRIIRDDETFLFRAVKELKTLYLKFMKIGHIPDYMRNNVLYRLYALMEHMEEKQRHAWVVSKAHARGYVKLADISIFSTRTERRRIRRQTIELDHLRNRIEPLKNKIARLSRIRTHEQIHTLHSDIEKLIELYQKEITDLGHIMHEADVLIRRTENLFKAIEKEAEELNLKGLKRKVSTYSKKFRKLLLKIEKQARREYLDIDHIVKKLPQSAQKPKAVAKKAKKKALKKPVRRAA